MSIVCCLLDPSFGLLFSSLDKLSMEISCRSVSDRMSCTRKAAFNNNNNNKVMAFRLDSGRTLLRRRYEQIRAARESLTTATNISSEHWTGVQGSTRFHIVHQEW